MKYQFIFGESESINEQFKSEYGVPNQGPSQVYNAPQSIPVIVLDDISQAGSYQVNPGGSTLFLNFAMTEMRMRARDTSGFPLPDRTWTIKETTPQPQQAA